MERVCKELDEVKGEMEKLKEDYRNKAELSENLRKAYNEQLTTLQEAKLKIERQAQELNSKAEEISLTRQMYEELKSHSQEKESALRHLSSANDKLRANCVEKLQEWEGEKRDLVLALDEANERIKDQELKTHAWKEEIEVLKGLLSASKKKCLEAEKRAQVSKELRQRDDLLQELDDKNRKTEDQLKWKKEQFKHLEEAHEKLQEQLRASTKEWELEKSTLLDEMSLLQTSLDSQTRISEDLKSRLQMCNQALAHEESRRKLMEVQVSETKTCLDNVSAEFEDAKSKIESLTNQRDEEIAALRNTLCTKETVSKEMDFRVRHLEQENQELQQSLKELQESQINEAGAASSLKKLRNKLRGLEQVHKECSADLKAREVKWSSQMGEMMKEFNETKFEVKYKEEQIQELQMELEACHSLIMQLKLENEETSLRLMVLNAGFSDAQSNLLCAKEEREVCNSEKDEEIAFLRDQLEINNNAVVKAHADIKQENEKVTELTRMIESLDLMEQQNFAMQIELQRYKEMLDESSGWQLHLKEQASQKENALREDLREVSEALDKANTELAEKIREEGEIDFELHSWRAIAEQLKIRLEENLETRKEMEASLLAQVETEQTLKQDKENLFHLVEQKDQDIHNLEQQILLLKQELVRRETDTTLAKMEVDQIAEEKDKTIDTLEKEIAWLEQESARRELEGAIITRLDAEKAFEKEKDRLCLLIEEKDQSIESLWQLNMSLEQNITSSVKTSVLSELEDKQAEINVLRKAWENTTTSGVLAQLEIEEKNLVIADLEGDISNLQQKLELQEKALSWSRQQVEQLEAALDTKKLELEKVTSQLENDLRISEGLIKELESEKRIIVEDLKKLSLEREDLVGHIVEVSDRISEFSSEDRSLMGILERIVQKFEEENEMGKDLTQDDELYHPSIENSNTLCSHMGKRHEFCPDERSPLKELNN